METESEYSSSTSGLQGIRKYFEAFMCLVYAALGIAVLTRFQELITISPVYSTTLGIALIAYSLFRGYRVFQRYF